MKKLNRTEQLAFAQQFPKPKIIGWSVVVMGRTLYGPADIRLCHHFCKQHNISKQTIKPSSWKQQ